MNNEFDKVLALFLGVVLGFALSAAFVWLVN